MGETGPGICEPLVSLKMRHVWRIYASAWESAESQYAERCPSGGSVTCDGETVRVFRSPDGSGEPVYCEPLADCRWFEASRRWRTFPEPEDFPGKTHGRSLMLELPESSKTRERHIPGRGGGAILQPGPVILMIGQTDELRQKWLDLLQTRSVTRDFERETQPPPFSQWQMLLGILFMFGFFAVYVFAMFLLRGFLIARGVPEDIVGGLVIGLTVPGMFACVLLWAVPFLARRARATGVGKTKRTRADQWVFVVMLFGVMCAYVIGPCFTMPDAPDMTIRTRVIATCLAVLIFLVTACILWSYYGDGKSNAASLESDDGKV